VKTDPEASARAKAPWTGLAFEGEVETEYLYATALAIYPFRLGPTKLCVLPLDLTQGNVRILDAGGVLKRGAPGLHRWLTVAEETWRARKKDSAAQAVRVEEYLDNHANLTRQQLGGIKLAYGADGTYVRAAVLDTDRIARETGARGFIFDMNMYWIRVESDREAHFLAAVLNTPFVNEAIKEVQTRGAFGARHIHRRPFEKLPIPEFNAQDPRHERLAELSAIAHDRLANTRIVRTQRLQLEPVTDEVAEADSLTRAICDAA
jgi:hypothetical protein